MNSNSGASHIGGIAGTSTGTGIGGSDLTSVLVNGSACVGLAFHSSTRLGCYSAAPREVIGRVRPPPRHSPYSSSGGSSSSSRGSEFGNPSLHVDGDDGLTVTGRDVRITTTDRGDGFYVDARSLPLRIAEGFNAPMVTRVRAARGLGGGQGAAHTHTPHALAVDHSSGTPGKLYWSDTGSGIIWRTDLPSGPPVATASGSGAAATVAVVSSIEQWASGLPKVHALALVSKSTSK